MNEYKKEDLIKEIATRLEMTEYEAENIYKELIAQLNERISNHEQIFIPNLGSIKAVSKTKDNEKNYVPKFKEKKSLSKELNQH